MNYTWLIDAGHGALNNSKEYTTAPDKMHTFSDGFTIFEGVIDRDIAMRVCMALNYYGLNYRTLFDHSKDTPLNERCIMANVLHQHYKNCIGISIHSNAGGGTGFEFWTTPGPDKSDQVADVMYKNYLLQFPAHKFRTGFVEDGDADKEAKFKILRDSDCPFVLVENLFFDYRKDAEQLAREDFRQHIVRAIVNTIVEIDKHKLI